MYESLKNKDFWTSILLLWNFCLCRGPNLWPCSPDPLLPQAQAFLPLVLDNKGTWQQVHAHGHPDTGLGCQGSDCTCWACGHDPGGLAGVQNRNTSGQSGMGWVWVFKQVFRKTYYRLPILQQGIWRSQRWSDKSKLRNWIAKAELRVNTLSWPEGSRCPYFRKSLKCRTEE